MARVTDTRDHLVAALEADLVGPFEEHEVLRFPPSRWYLTGFLAAMDARLLENEPEDDEVLGAGSDLDSDDGAPADGGAKSRHFLPASFGLSVLLPPAAPGDALAASVTWADYKAETVDDDDPATGKSKTTLWRRHPRDPVKVSLPLDARALSLGVTLPGAPGVVLRGKLATASRTPGLPEGARALSLFLINQRPAAGKRKEDERFLFQVRLELEFPAGFLPRPNWRDEPSAEFDERVADLQFRNQVEWAVGHGTAVRELPDEDGIVRRVSTTFLPRCEVPKVETRKLDSVETRMEILAGLDDPPALIQALADIPAAYTRWIAKQAASDPGSEKRRETRDLLLADARRACARIAEGLELLAQDREVRLAFRLMNEAMAAQARRLRDEEPRWRLFQLAFVLLNLPSLADPSHRDRERVELIYFPTGGGKTEAYLGVIATVLLLRRLRGRNRPDGGDGVAVLLRYTLRLLTLDQLSRAATLICALELIRRREREALGETRFAIGLWVGKSATANTFKEVAKQITEFKNRRDSVVSPLPITNCPWCRTPIDRDGIRLYPRQKPDEVQIHCLADECPFHSDASPSGLPLVFVDEQIYRQLPSFLIATVDKLAMLPWRGETGLLFGRALFRSGGSFFGPLDRPPQDGKKLPTGLLPPELIVQDELHLISGPLGTMVGLYETAVEQLCLAPQKPKILAATATVRQSTAQVRALFGRETPPALFPPPGIDDGETFFAYRDTKTAGRLYLGLAAPGRAMKALLLRAYVGLLAAAQTSWEAERGGAGEATADAYMTLVGYFNTLRELGGMRRLVEDEVVRLCHGRGERRPEGGGASPFRDRRLQDEPVELTSREPTSSIAEAKDRLARPFADKKHVDVLLASNMISVGVDISRLGLMVIAGQPKTTAEYIQASSRVGRQPAVGPGLVVTCYNVHKARDRSHYEHFAAYHRSFYRFVEASSLTPFSTRALGRGLAATLVALTRFGDAAMTPNPAAARISQHRAVAEKALAAIVARAARHRTMDAATSQAVAGELEQLGRALLDSWERVAQEAHGSGGRRYSPFDLEHQGGRPLLFSALDDNPPAPNGDDARFEAPTSMRDVEPAVDLWLERQPLGGYRPS